MGGWLVQVPVKRFGTEATVHVYAVWLPDHTDALAAVEKRVEAPSEVPELLIELADGAMARCNTTATMLKMLRWRAVS